jgi:hypothetical protein
MGQKSACNMGLLPQPRKDQTRLEYVDIGCALSSILRSILKDTLNKMARTMKKRNMASKRYIGLPLRGTKYETE